MEILMQVEIQPRDMRRSDLTAGEIGEFYRGYIDLIPGEAELIETLQKNTYETCEFLKSIPPEKWQYRYTAGKWSLLEMIQHLLDTERIFQYRALCFARNEQQSLPGFDHDNYAINSGADTRKAADLIKEFRAVRESGIYMYESFTDDMLKRKGKMNDMNATPRGIGFIMVGHALHHKEVISQKYL